MKIQQYKMFIVNCGIYPFEIFIYLGKDRKPLFKNLEKYIDNELIEKIKTQEFTDGTHGRSIILHDGKMIIYNDTIPNSIADIGLLIHEIFHCVVFLMERLHIKLSRNTDEAYAYLLQYLTVNIFNELNIKFK